MPKTTKKKRNKPVKSDAKAKQINVSAAVANQRGRGGREGPEDATGRARGRETERARASTRVAK